MKTIKWFALVAASVALFSNIVKGFTIDGTAEADYGSALATQTLATAALGQSTFGRNNDMALIDQADGSELDAAYGVITNGTLFLVLAGNIDSGGTGSVESVQFDKLHVFFMTGPGGDHTLGTNYNGSADFGRLNRMGVNGGGINANAGLTFDPGFAPNYWIGTTIGGAGTNPTFYVNYEVVCANCNGAFLGSSAPSNTMVDGSFGIRAALNNINTNGVSGDPAGCATNLDQASVRTGVELSIPLPTIGSPTGKVSICAFITDDAFDLMYNQVLGPVNTNGCVQFFSIDGDPSGIDFGTLPGTHSFTITVPPCEAFLLNPTTASYGTNGGSGSASLQMQGSCSWQATSSVSWVTITSALSGSGNATITYSVAVNSTVSPRTGVLTVSGGDGATANVVISQDGIFLPPLGSIVVNGIAESSYGCPIAVQRLGSGFGQQTTTNLMSNAGGSELDAAYGLIKDNVLFLTFAGNLENNNNRLDIFFMTDPTSGRNTLTNLQVSVNSNSNENWDAHLGGVNVMATRTNATNPGPGLTFDPGFNPNYIISVNGGGSPATYKFFVNYAQLWPGGTNSLGIATNGYFVGSTTTTNGTLALGADGLNPFGIQATINDSNTNGVSGGPGGGNGCTTNSTTLALESDAAGLVRSGVELGIPLAAFGNPTGTIAICAIITSGDHTFPSNQILGPMGTNDPTVGSCQANLGSVTNIANINLANFSGGPHFFYVGPEMRVTSIQLITNTTVKLSYQTEFNTNLTYQVQAATNQNLVIAQTNNVVWRNIGGLSVGNGQVITITDPFGGTNKSPWFYRVRQTPLCQ